MPLKLSITIVHDKSPQENAAQIAALLAMVERITDDHTDPNTGESWQTYHYAFPDLPLPHEVRFYQVIPYGVPPPANLYVLDSHKVFYGAEDSDKGASRFFNWGLKRGTDQGAMVAIYLQSPKNLDLEALAVACNSLADPGDKHELVDDAVMKVASRKLLQEVGQLDERKSFSQAVSDLKGRVSRGGLKTG